MAELQNCDSAIFVYSFLKMIKSFYFFKYNTN